MKTETQHTPGPWETSRDAVPAGHVQITVYEFVSGDRVATVFQNEANARLIAAAPDLLAALEAMLAAYAFNATLQKREDLHSAVRDSLDALAKARGAA